MLADARQKLAEVREAGLGQWVAGPLGRPFIAAGQKLTGLDDADLYAALSTAGAQVGSMAARPFSRSTADSLVRQGDAFSQAATETDEEGAVPADLQKAYRGAVSSLTPSVAAGVVGGPYGAIGYAAASEANQAITSGREAGLKGGSLAGYVLSKGTVEAAPAIVMQKVGLGGLEKYLGGKAKAAAGGVWAALKKLGLDVASEQFEEQVTETLGHNLVDHLAGVEETSWEKTRRTAYDTALQTFASFGLPAAQTAVELPAAAKREQQVGRFGAWKFARENAQAASRLAALDHPPSRKDWEDTGLPSIPQSRRDEFKGWVDEALNQQAEMPEVEVLVGPPGASEDRGGVDGGDVGTAAEPPVEAEAVAAPTPGEGEVTEQPPPAAPQPEEQVAAQPEGLEGADLLGELDALTGEIEQEDGAEPAVAPVQAGEEPAPQPPAAAEQLPSEAPAAEPATPAVDPKQLADSNLGLVDPIAKNIRRSARSIPLGDLIGEGYLALREAAEAYDPAKGPFENYANNAIKNRLRRYAGLELEQQAPGGQELPEPKAKDQGPQLDILLEKFSQLSPESQETLALRFGLGKKAAQSLSKIAAEKGISKQALSKQHRKILDGLKEQLIDAGVSYQAETPGPARIGADAWQAAIPGAKVRELDDGMGFEVTVPNGRSFRAVWERDIAIAPDVLMKDYGMTRAQAERASVLGMTIEFSDGTRSLADLMVLVDPKGNTATLRHEAVHVARALGLFLDENGGPNSQWKALLEKYGSEEGIANARAAWQGKKGLWEQFRQALRRFLDRMGLVGMDAKTAMALMERPEFWSKPVREGGRKDLWQGGSEGGVAGVSAQVAPDDPRRAKAQDIAAKYVAQQMAAGKDLDTTIKEAAARQPSGRLEPYIREAWEKQSAAQAAPAPTEPATSTGTTGVKREKVWEMQDSRGEPRSTPLEAKSQEDMLAIAKGILDTDPTAHTRLAAELSQKQRPISGIEFSLLNLYLRQLENAYAKATAEGDVTAKKAVKIEIDALQEVLLGPRSEWHMAGMAQQVELREDLSISQMEREARDAVGGRPLTAEEQSEVDKAYEKLAKLQAQLNEALAKQAQAAAPTDDDIKREVDRRVKESVSRARKPSAARQSMPPRLQAIGDKLRAAFTKVAGKSAQVGPQRSYSAVEPTGEAESAEVDLESLADEAIAAALEAGAGNFYQALTMVRRAAGLKTIPPSLKGSLQIAWRDAAKQGLVPEPRYNLQDLPNVARMAQDIAQWVVESGVTDSDAIMERVHEVLQQYIPDITMRETREAYSGYGKFRPPTKDEVKLRLIDLRSQVQKELAIEDMEAGQASLRTGQGRPDPSSTVRDRIKQVNERKRQGGYVVTDPDRQHRTALDAAKRAILNRIDELTREIDSKQKVLRTKTPLGTDAEYDQLVKERDELLKKHREIFAPNLTDEQRIKRAEQALDRSLKRLLREVEEHDIMPKGKTPLTSPKIEKTRAEIARLQRVKKELRANSPEYQATLEDKWRAQYIRRLTEDIDELLRRTRDQDFSKPPKKEHKPDATINRLKWMKSRDLKRYKDLLAAWEFKQKSKLAKAGALLLEGAHLSRSIITSVDWSAVFRQGSWALFSHPLMAAKALPGMAHATFSDATAYRIANELMNRPGAQLGDQAGLELTSMEGRIGAQEEAFMSRLPWLHPKIRKVVLAPVHASERAYIAYLNTMRAGVFDAMVQAWGGKDITLDQAKRIANYVNIATGRGNLGGFAKAAEILAAGIFAPRYVVSRFQLALGQPLWQGDAKTRSVIAKEYARAMGGMGLFYGMIYLASKAFWDDDDDERPQVEWDLRSSDAGKIRMGNVRIDPMGGMSQALVLMGRTISGERKTKTGAILPLRNKLRLTTTGEVPYGGLDMQDAYTFFLRSKLSPVASTAANWITGENILGERTTLQQTAIDSFIPMSLRDTVKAAEEMGPFKGLAVSMAAVMGANMAIHERGEIGEFNDRRATLQREKASTAEMRRLSRADDLMGRLKKLAESQPESGEAQTRTEFYRAGLARWAMGQKAKDRYPNPLTDQNLPPDVRKVVDEHLAVTAAAAAGLENPKKAKEKAVANMQGAVDYLKAVGADRDKLLDLLMARMKSQGAGREARRHWRARLLRRLGN
jgi:RNA polymerase sigma factor (sigma-70 family)